ncbi:hypothetical protein O5268_23165 [Escherichia coli]|nr:hypothetical protein [Escherichia coli]
MLLVVINATIQSLPYLLLKREMMAKKMPRRSGSQHIPLARQWNVQVRVCPPPRHQP